MKKFSMKFIDHFRHLGHYFLIVICIPLMVYYLFLFKKGYFDLRKGFLIGGIFFIIYSIPILLLHLNYYFNNHGDIFNYDSYSGKVIFEKKGKRIKFEKKIFLKSQFLNRGLCQEMIFQYSLGIITIMQLLN